MLAVNNAHDHETTASPFSVAVKRAAIPSTFTYVWVYICDIYLYIYNAQTSPRVLRRNVKAAPLPASKPTSAAADKSLATGASWESKLRISPLRISPAKVSWNKRKPFCDHNNDAKSGKAVILTITRRCTTTLFTT